MLEFSIAWDEIGAGRLAVSEKSALSLMCWMRLKTIFVGPCPWQDGFRFNLSRSPDIFIMSTRAKSVRTVFGACKPDNATEPVGWRCSAPDESYGRVTATDKSTWTAATADWSGDGIENYSLASSPPPLSARTTCVSNRVLVYCVSRYVRYLPAGHWNGLRQWNPKTQRRRYFGTGNSGRNNNAVKGCVCGGGAVGSDQGRMQK